MKKWLLKGHEVTEGKNYFPGPKDNPIEEKGKNTTFYPATAR